MFSCNVYFVLLLALYRCNYAYQCPDNNLKMFTGETGAAGRVINAGKIK